MFAREGYVPLSRLWSDFESRFLRVCRIRALAMMNADPHSLKFVFGTALDLCEDIFLSTFDKFHFSLVPTNGDVIEVDAALPHSGARLLLKTTAFEAAQISILPDESGPDGTWLKQMGSSAFRAADHGWLWPDRRGRSTGEELERVLFAKVFHTLPILFERPAFVIAQELPPWSNDLLDESYVRNIWREVNGSAICLSDQSARAWRKSQTDENIGLILASMLSGNPASAALGGGPSGGRPEKVTVVMQAYQELGLADKNLTRKEEVRRLEETMNLGVSTSTLERARRLLKTESIKDNGDQC
jgi:hypothetical protein